MATAKIGIETVKGKLRLRLPRREKRYLNSGLDATDANFKRVQAIAWMMESDLLAHSFDETLEKYKGQILPQKIAAPSPSHSLLNLWEKYIDWKRSQVSPTYWKKDLAGTYLRWIAKIPDRSKPNEVSSWLLKQTSPMVVKELLTQINAAHKWGLKQGLITENGFAGLAADIRVSAHRKGIDPFSRDELATILGAFADTHYYGFVFFLANTGCRPGEAVALRWSEMAADCSSVLINASYDGNSKIRKDTKTHKPRRIPCNSGLKSMLDSLERSQGLVFPSTTGGYITNSHFTRDIWKVLLQGKTERHRTPYNLRHTAITRWLEQGISIVQVAEWAGNSPEVILKHYAGITQQKNIPEL
jgi:integrase